MMGRTLGMERHSRNRLAVLLAVVVLAATILAGTSACSHQTTTLNTPTTTPSGRDIPFHQEAQSPDTESDSAASRSVPFNNPLQDLPAGTLLTVRLETALSSAKPGSSGTFAAILDDPIVVEGKTIVARGANVLGRIESARASELKRGYLRLTLDSIHLQGRDLRLQTSSLFARGSVHASEVSQKPDNQPRIIDLQKGRRLTFRLMEAALPIG